MTTFDSTEAGRLRFAVETFTDVQHLRIATSNRVSAADRDVATLDPRLAESLTTHLHHAENDARTAVRRAYRTFASPAVRRWQETTRGVGDHTLALLLAEIGDPIIAIPLDRDGNIVEEPYRRTVANLTAYCGHGDPARRRRRGMTQDDARAGGNPTAKSAVFLLAEAQVKSRGHYRPLYDRAKARAVETHPDWTDGHRHAHALRVVGRQIVTDLHRVRAKEVRALDLEHVA